MIVIEGSWWPLVVVGHVDGAAAARSTDILLDERCLELSAELRVALVVAGAGAAALKAQREILAWLQRSERMLDQRTHRLAWVIEDAECRACTNAWLGLSPSPLFNAPAAAFRTVAEAIAWLLKPSIRAIAPLRSAKRR